MLRLRLGQPDDAIAQLAKPGAARDQLGICDVRVPVLGSPEDASFSLEKLSAWYVFV
jgi:hypothetical protein